MPPALSLAQVWVPSSHGCGVGGRGIVGPFGVGGTLGQSVGYFVGAREVGDSVGATDGTGVGRSVGGDGEGAVDGAGVDTPLASSIVLQNTLAHLVSSSSVSPGCIFRQSARLMSVHSAGESPSLNLLAPGGVKCVRGVCLCGVGVAVGNPVGAVIPPDVPCFSPSSEASIESVSFSLSCAVSTADVGDPVGRCEGAPVFDARFACIAFACFAFASIRSCAAFSGIVSLVTLPILDSCASLDV